MPQTAKPYAPGKDWIQVYSGKKFWPLNPRIQDIELEDIAHALSMQCRFTGHMLRHYSVAEHSLNVCRVVRYLGGSDEEQRQALLHDASEAYLCDIASPVKRGDEFRGYRTAEERLERMIYRSFNLPEKMLPIVKRADMIMLKIEARSLFTKLQPEWTGWLDEIEDIPEVTQVSKTWIFPYTIKQYFLNKATRLGLT